MRTMRIIAVLLLVLIALPLIAEQSSVTTLKVEGMDCKGCEGKVRRALLEIDGVEKAEVSYEESTANVTFDASKTTPDKISSALEKALDGYTVAVAKEKKS